MFKIKNLTILALITVASIENIYSIDSLIDDEGRKSKGHHHGKEVKHEQESKSHHGGAYIAKHRYGLLGDNKNNSSIVDALKTHPAMQKGTALLASLTATSLPLSYDMRSIMDGSNFIYSSNSNPLSATLFAVYNQGQIGDCTANAGAGAMQFCQIRDAIAKLPTGAKVSTSNVVPFVPSRLFIYWNERLNSGGVSATKVDNGASMSDIIYALVNNGVCPETDWPETNSFSTKPSATAFNDALKDVDMDVGKNSSALNNETNIISNVVATQITGAGTTLLTNIKTALYSNHPVLFGISVYSSFESTNADSTGVIPLPPTNDELLGGHALMFVGYNDNATYPSYTFNYTSNTNKPKTVTQTPLTGYFTFRNSWGSGTGNNGWGNQGYGYIPYSYITNSTLTGNTSSAPEFYMVTKTTL